MTCRHSPNARNRAAARGFTLIEVALCLAVIGVLASAAVPTWQSQIRQARRADAYVAIGLVHQAQERWRAMAPAYATRFGPEGLALAAASPLGHYTLRLEGAAPGAAEGYVVTATARGSQAGDRACAHIRMVVDGADLRFESAPSAGPDNGTAANRRCWGR